MTHSSGTRPGRGRARLGVSEQNHHGVALGSPTHTAGHDILPLARGTAASVLSVPRRGRPRRALERPQRQKKQARAAANSWKLRLRYWSLRYSFASRLVISNRSSLRETMQLLCGTLYWSMRAPLHDDAPLGCEQLSASNWKRISSFLAGLMPIFWFSVIKGFWGSVKVIVHPPCGYAAMPCPSLILICTAYLSYSLLAPSPQRRRLLIQAEQF